jgi:hypothetical protein
VMGDAGGSGFASLGGHRRPVGHSETFYAAQSLHLVTMSEALGGQSVDAHFQWGSSRWCDTNLWHTPASPRRWRSRQRR